MISEFAQAAFVTFVYVFFRAFQQLNVIHKHYWRIPFASLAMGLGDVMLVILVVKTQTLWMGVTNGVAGMLGCYGAMYMNERISKRINR